MCQPQALQCPANRRLAQACARWQRRQTNGVLGERVISARYDQPGQELVLLTIRLARGAAAVPFGGGAAALAHSAAHVAYEAHADLEAFGDLRACALLLLASAPHPFA